LTPTRKATRGNSRRQALQRFLLGLFLVPTILVWLLVGSSFFGYHLIITHGASMEPVLKDGDAILVKEIDAAEVKVGDIVTLSLPGEQLVTHQLIQVNSLSPGVLLLVTQGNGTQFTESFVMSADETVEVLVARVPFAGYILDFLRSMLGTVLLTGVLIFLVAIWMRRRRPSPSSVSREISNDPELKEKAASRPRGD